MRYAIDRIRTGSEREVHANEFAAMPNIPFRLSRFFCPECGEQVFWRSGGGSHPCQFYHKTRTDTSPECDKRVDGRSELYVYERVGLPLYLTRINAVEFQLNLGFPAIGETALEIAKKHNGKVTIACDNRFREISVNQTHFVANSTTLVPIKFVPLQGRNYQINYCGVYSTNRKWADYSDGFASGGGVFSYGENGGKKVRRGDSISPGKQYYLVTTSLDQRYSEIEYSSVGTVLLNSKTYTVYTMRVNVSVKNEYRYTQINQHIHSRFGVWLLETVPEIIPIWPPVIEQDVLIPASTTKKLFCAVSSCNEVPQVFSYSANSVSTLNVVTKKGLSMVTIPIYTGETLVSVDRKYVGREVAFERKKPYHIDPTYQIGLTTKSGQALDRDSLTMDDLTADIGVVCNAKMEVYLESRDHTFLHIPVRERNVLLPGRQNITNVYFSVENAIIYGLHTTIPEVLPSQLELTISQIRNNCRGVLVPVPRWILSITAELGKNIVDEVYRHIVNGCIPIGIVQMLSEL